MVGFNKTGMMSIAPGAQAPSTMQNMGMTTQKSTNVVKLLNFAHLMNQQQEKYHKKQYNHAEYFSPEQIEKSEDPTIMQAGELWNVGVITYALYQGHFPITGEGDEKIINNIIARPNNWVPTWRDGIFDSLKTFILMCLDADPYKRLDKI